MRDTISPTAGKLALGAALLVLATSPAGAEERARADVAVLVDTSTSMRQEGMDPQRTSLLVTKLLADIVPGELAVVRLLDLAADAADLPRRETGKKEPCAEDPSKLCGVVEAASDWQADARRKRLGALARPARGDAAYKLELEDHLEQRINNSPFYLAFRAAQGVFDERPADGAPRTVIWLSDGRADQEVALREVIGELRDGGVTVKAIVFGRGDTRLADEIGLAPLRVSSPAEIMHAFAGAFRSIVQAPFEIDHRIVDQPAFEMKPNVDEAWIVVYGDDSLEEATLDGPAGSFAADFAADRWRGAGAYRVAYFRRPAAGSWTVRARGGGAGTAYAVVQRSALHPALLEPDRAVSGAPVQLVAGVRAGLDGELLAGSEVLADTAVTASFQGDTYDLADDGTGADETAGDGRYTARVVFRGAGTVDVAVRLRSPVVDRTAEDTVAVSGVFRYAGDAPLVDLGTLEAGTSSCRTLRFDAEHEGEVPLELRGLREPPAGHALRLRLGAGTLRPGGGALPSAPGDAYEVCLETSRRAPDSAAGGEPWLALALAGSDDPGQRVPLALVWRVESLGFWELWGRLILTVIAVLTALFLVGGYVWPQRFQRSLALTFVPDADEIDEQTPQPVAQWKGVGIGFYRHARAFLQPDYRLSGRAQGALASLHAEKNATSVRAARTGALYRETLDGDWEAVAGEGRRARPGDVYRVGENGPFFRISLQGGRR